MTEGPASEGEAFPLLAFRRIGQASRRLFAGLNLDYGPNVLILLLLVLVVAMEDPFALWPLSAPAASRGFLDARAHLASRGSISLDGDWGAYWGKLISPAGLSGTALPPPDGLASLPSAWTRKSGLGGGLPSYGTATYTLVLRHGLAGREVGVRIGRINTAFVLYADGLPVASAGTLSASAEGFRGAYRPQCAFFVPASDETTLVLEVANHVLPNGGAIDPLCFGTRRAIETLENGSVFADAFTIGGKALFALLFLAVSFLLRSRLALLFSAYNLAMAVRGCFSHELLGFRLFPELGLQGYTAFTGVTSGLILLLHMLVIYAFTCEVPSARPEPEIPEPASPLRKTRRQGRIMAWSAVAFGAVCAYYVLQAAFLPTLTETAAVYLVIPLGLFCLFYPLRLLFLYTARHDRHRVVLWFYIMYTCDTLSILASQVAMRPEPGLRPFFFLAPFGRMDRLASVSIPHQYYTYAIVVAFCFYFLNALVRSRLDRLPPLRNEPKAAALKERFGVTAREEEIMLLAVKGLTYEEMAEACFVSANTIKAHLKSIYRKLGVKNKTELAARLQAMTPLSDRGD
jgi:DNA-binding CsgD family transcriptional regulator